MKLRKTKLAALFSAVLLALSACGGSEVSDKNNSGGSDTGESAPYTVQGQLTNSELHGGKVMALSNQGEVIEGRVGEDGSMELGLEDGRAYTLNFLKDDSFRAVLYFQEKSFTSEMSNLLRLPEKNTSREQALAVRRQAEEHAESEDESDDPSLPEEAEANSNIDMGEIDTEGGRATPERSPTSQIDTDGDGTPDAEEEDANDNGVADHLEEDETADIDSSNIGLIVREVEPAPGSQNVDPTEKIEVEFNQPIDPSSVSGDVVTLSTDSGDAVDGEVSVQGEEEVIFVPSSELDFNTKYKLTIGTDVTSAERQALSTEFTLPFKTEKEGGDSNADRLRIDKIDPKHGAQSVAVDASIIAEFNQPLAVDIQTGEDTFQLLGQRRNSVDGELTVDEDELVFKPSSKLEKSTKYQAVLGKTLASEDGDEFGRKLVLTFFTDGDPGDRGRGGQNRPDVAEDRGDDNRPDISEDRGDDRRPDGVGADGVSDRDGGRRDVGSDRGEDREDASGDLGEDREDASGNRGRDAEASGDDNTPDTTDDARDAGSDSGEQQDATDDDGDAGGNNSGRGGN